MGLLLKKRKKYNTVEEYLNKKRKIKN